MAKMNQLRAEETERRLQAALADGALPGESEGFDDQAAQDAARFMTAALAVRMPGMPVIEIGQLLCCHSRSA